MTAGPTSHCVVGTQPSHTQRVIQSVIQSLKVTAGGHHLGSCCCAASEPCHFFKEYVICPIIIKLALWAAQANVHQGGGFGGVNVSYNHLEAGGAAAALAQQMELHAAVRASVAAPRLPSWFDTLQVPTARPAHSARCLVTEAQVSVFCAQPGAREREREKLNAVRVPFIISFPWFFPPRV